MNSLILSGVVYVIFEDQETAYQICKKWKISKWKAFFLELCSCIPVFRGYNFKGRILTIRRAHEPSDILWENLGCHGWDKTSRKAKTIILTAITIAICSAILFGIGVGKSQTDSQFLAILSSVIVVVNNGVIYMLINYYAGEEKHKSYTEFHKSIAVKLTFA